MYVCASISQWPGSDHDAPGAHHQLHQAGTYLGEQAVKNENVSQSISGQYPVHVPLGQ
jgi:hypothetical protein